MSKLPFGENLEDPYEIYKEILEQKKLQFPNYFYDKNAKLLI